MSAAVPPTLVLGMHRSGTSYLAEVVQALGVKLGEHLVGAQKGNPRGHFEDREVLVFHEALLDRRTAGQPRAFDPGMMVTAPSSGMPGLTKATCPSLAPLATMKRSTPPASSSRCR